MKLNIQVSIVSKLDRISTVVDFAPSVIASKVSKLDRISTVVDGRLASSPTQFPSLIEFLLL